MKTLTTIALLLCSIAVGCTPKVDDFQDHSEIDFSEYYDTEIALINRMIEIDLKSVSWNRNYTHNALLYKLTGDDKYRREANKYVDSVKIYLKEYTLLKNIIEP